MSEKWIAQWFGSKRFSYPMYVKNRNWCGFGLTQSHRRVLRQWNPHSAALPSGWPDEFVKSRPKCRPNNFMSKLIQKVNRGKRSPKMWGTSVISKKNFLKQTITQWAKIRPIWSPCLPLNYSNAKTVHRKRVLLNVLQITNPCIFNK
jgi:hypothetical protein